MTVPTSQAPLPAKALLPAKNPANLIAGVYGHPTHPVAVMLPLGAWVSSLALDVLSRGSKGKTSKGYARSSRSLIGFGLLGAGGAALTGLLDYSTIPGGTKAKKLATAHLLMNVGAIASYATNFLSRDPDETVSDAAFKQSAWTAMALGVSGALGGELAFRYGVRVASEESQAKGYVGSNLAVDPYAAGREGVTDSVAGHQGIDPY